MNRAKSATVILRTLIAMPLLAGGLAACGSPEQKAKGYYDRGIELINKGDDLNARLELLNAAKYKSDNVDTWRALAGIDERTKASSLFSDLRRIVELDPNDLESRLKLAKIMLAGGATDAASKVIELAREGDTPNSELHALRAILLARGNDLAGAMREANRATTIDANNVDAISFIAMRKVAEGNPKEAVTLLDSVNVEGNDKTRILELKVRALMSNGDLAGAEEIQRSVVAASPNEKPPRALLVQILLAERKLDAAEKEWRARIDLDPKDSKTVLDLVRFLNTTKGPQAARAELENRIKVGGDVFEYQLALSEIDVAQGKIDDAIELLRDLASSASAADRKAAAQLKLAEIYVSRNDLATAEPIITQIIAVDRRNVGAQRLRASIKLNRGQVDEAISDLREALNDQPKSADLLLTLALAYERGGKPELAERQYADATKSSSYNPAVVLRYIAFLQRKGDAAQAERVLSDAVDRNAGNVQLLSSLAQVRLARRDWVGARAIADIIAKSPENVVLADELRAASYSGENKSEQSIAALESAHKGAPDAVQPVTALISAYLRQNQADKASSLLQEMLKKFPANAALLVLQGRVDVAQSKDDAAAESFKAAIAGQPKDPAGYLALSDFYARKKNYQAAIEATQDGLRARPADLNLQMMFASVAILKGDFDAAITQYDSILKEQPRQIVAINNLVSLLLDRKGDKASIDRAALLAEPLKDSKLPQFQDTYGWAQYMRGDYPSAVKYLESAVQQIGNQALVHYHLGMSYTKVGEAAKAADQLNTALRLEPDNTPLREKITSALGELTAK